LKKVLQEAHLGNETIYFQFQCLFQCCDLGSFNAGLSFRTTEESLRNAFQNFGQLGDGENSEQYVAFSS